MASQQFCLKWNNHQANLLNVFGSLLSSQVLVDVTLVCEGSKIKAHQVVLSACSPFFHDIFINNPCKHPVVILNDMKYDDLQAILQFMYKGEVNISQDKLSALLKIAENLEIKGLTEVNSKQKHLDTVNDVVNKVTLQNASPENTAPEASNRKRKRKKSETSTPCNTFKEQVNHSEVELTSNSRVNCANIVQESSSSNPESSQPDENRLLLSYEIKKSPSHYRSANDNLDLSDFMEQSLTTDNNKHSSNKIEGNAQTSDDSPLDVFENCTIEDNDNCIYPADDGSQTINASALSSFDDMPDMGLQYDSSMDDIKSIANIPEAGTSKSSRSTNNKNSTGDNSKNADKRNTPLPCTVCKRNFNFPCQLRRHMIAKHTCQRFYCDKCPANYTQRDNLIQHLRRGRHVL